MGSASSMINSGIVLGFVCAWFKTLSSELGRKTQPRPDSGLGFQAKATETFQVVPPLLDIGFGFRVWVPGR